LARDDNVEVSLDVVPEQLRLLEREEVSALRG
jgi:hypothetical protein